MACVFPRARRVLPMCAGRHGAVCARPVGPLTDMTDMTLFCRDFPEVVAAP